ncbi:MAG: hypothetical protein FWC77_02380 [Defluviitaleaceae bacterium]|nr:hypothetical protein [Defluviitaleaceae bacterium]
MIRQVAFTVTGIILSFAIAIGGWAVTVRLLETRAHNLFYGVMYFEMEIPTVAADSPYEYDDTPGLLRLSMEDMASVLRNWDTGVFERRFHEPAPGQIDMEQAIAVGREGLELLREFNILPLELLTFAGTSVYLVQNTPVVREFLPPEYSYWELRFSSDILDIRIVINAATGQLWQMQVHVLTWMQPDGHRAQAALGISHEDMANTLAAFMTGLELDFDADAMEVVMSEPHARVFTPPAPWLVPTPPVQVSDMGYLYALDATTQTGIRITSSAGDGVSGMVYAWAVPDSEDRLYFSHFNVQLLPTRGYEAYVSHW